ncbi:MAG: hypothetical protein IKM07_01660 [Clostridia bacterium]|nr:hypothetical protein [Clostridia bacterium]
MKKLLEKLLTALPGWDMDNDAREAVMKSARALIGDDALMITAKEYYECWFAPDADCKDIVELSIPAADAVMGENMIFTVLFFARTVELEEAGIYVYGPDNTPVDFRGTVLRHLTSFYRRNDCYGIATSSRKHMYDYVRPTMMQVGRLVYELNSFPFEYEVWRSRKTGETIPVMNAGLIFDDTDRPHTEGSFTTTRTIADGKLTGYTYTEKGLLDRTPVTLDMNEWEPFIVKGDPVVSLHIPGNARFTPDVVDQSLVYGKEFLAKYFPDFHYKAFICSSWLLGTDLAQFVREDSNILKFQSRFRIGLAFRNGFSIFDNVFNVPKHCPIEELVPTNRFQREILEMVKAGGTLYSGRGYFLKD